MRTTVFANLAVFALLAAIAYGGEVACAGNNPLQVDGHPFYGADPSVVISGDGRLFLFPTTDNRDWDKQVGWSCYSTRNLTDWTNHGVVFDADASKWGTRKAWAPDIVERDGTFYFYYYFNVGEPHGGIGVASATNPEGPFREMLGKPLMKGHDPAVFVDDDGQAYLYQQDRVTKLGNDMISLQGDTQQLELSYVPDPFEATYVFKRDGVYYYTIAKEWNNLIYYTGSSPLGPFEYRGEIMAAYGGNNHHAIVQYGGKWILFYHQWLKRDAVHQRQLRADEMQFNPDGTIQLVVPTTEGVTPDVAD